MTNESLNLESKILKLEGIMDELESIGINTADKRATLNSTILLMKKCLKLISYSF